MVTLIKESTTNWIDMDDMEDYVYILEKSLDTVYSKIDDPYVDYLYDDIQTILDILNTSITKLESSESSVDVVNSYLIKAQPRIKWFVQGLQQNPQRLINVYYDNYVTTLIDYVELGKLKTYLFGNTDIGYMHKV